MGRRRLYRQRVQPGIELIRQQSMDQAFARNPAFLCKFGRYDFDTIVRFSTRARTGMTGMLIRFVDYDEVVGFER